MNSVFQGRSLLAEKDFTRAELEYLVDFSIHLKELKKKGIPHHYLEGKNIALLFEKTSTRTRSAFTTAAIDLGAHPEYLGANDIQLGKKESVEDTAIVLGSMFDGIEFRGFSQEVVEDLAKYSGVPVWNGLTDQWHPTQMIADFMTVKENFGRLEGITLVYVGDGRNNMANSLLVTGAILGVNVRICAPKELFPSDEVVNYAKEFAKESGAELMITDDVAKGVKGANVLYTDVWVSMGEEDKFEERVNLLKPYQINMAMLEKTENMDGDLIVLHCLPAFHDTKTQYGEMVAEKFGITEMEITDEVFRSKYGRQFDEENSEIIRKNTTPKAKIQMVVGDGLSSAAIEANIKEVLPAIKQGLNMYNLDFDNVVFVKYCRVPAMDKIGEITDADVVCLLVGERPGLVTAESMSAYIAYKPTVGMPEARRTVISNIHKGGTPAVEAGAYIAEIIKKMLDKKKSGIDLKEAE